MWNLKNQGHKKRDQTSGRQGVGRGSGNWMKVVKRQVRPVVRCLTLGMKLQHGDYSFAYLKVAKIIGLKSSHRKEKRHKDKKFICP